MERDIIKKLIAHIKAECTAINQQERYDEMLDECYSFKDVGGPFAHMSPSRVLRECDETCYRCGMNDYFDGDHYEIGCELYEKDAVNKERDTFADEIDSQIKDLETEIEEMEAEDDPNISDLAKLKRDVAELIDDKKAVEQYAF